MTNTPRIIGHMTPQQLKTQTRIRSLLINRKIKSHGKVIGSAIVTDIKGLPFGYARCKIHIGSNGLYATRNGLYVRPVGKDVLKDKSFERVA